MTERSTFNAQSDCPHRSTIDRAGLHWAGVALAGMTSTAACELIVAMGGRIQEPETDFPAYPDEMEWRIVLLGVYASGHTLPAAINEWIDLAKITLDHASPLPTYRELVQIIQNDQKSRAPNLRAAELHCPPPLKHGGATLGGGPTSAPEQKPWASGWYILPAAAIGATMIAAAIAFYLAA